MEIKVINPGIQTTIQDLGRQLYGPFGVSTCGAADNYSFKIANLIVGNKPSEAALEMTLVGGIYRFYKNTTICLSGSVFSAKINNKVCPFNKKINIKKNSVLEIGQTTDGSRCYLAIKGGINVKKYLGSSSTHLGTKTGGENGHALKKGDLLNIGKPKINRDVYNYNDIINKVDLKYSTKRSIIRITKGPQKDWFNNLNWDTLLKKTFKVSKYFDRMGIRLEGPLIKQKNSNQMLTQGISLGGIQIPGNGQPIISFVDHQTTGGYPVIANVITIDICKVGQLKKGDSFQFDLVKMKTAEAMRIEQSTLL